MFDNPWNSVDLSDYEGHMSEPSVGQLGMLSDIMANQLNTGGARTVMILGAAGGNGFEHIIPARFDKVYAVDINEKYLEKCVSRYPNLGSILSAIVADVSDNDVRLPHAELVIADMFIEYTGINAFARALMKVSPEYVSCVIQSNEGANFVSDTKYADSLSKLEKLHRNIDEGELSRGLRAIGYGITSRNEFHLPNRKRFIQLDYKRDGYVCTRSICQ